MRSKLCSCNSVHLTGGLKALCLRQLGESFAWQQQFMALQALPSELVDRILAELLRKRPLHPSHLVFFADAASELTLDGAFKHMRSSRRGTEWLSAAAQFRGLTRLSLARLPRLRAEDLALLAPASSSLVHLSIQDCALVTSAAVSHLPACMPRLRSLAISCKACPSAPPLHSADSQHSRLSCISQWTSLTALNLNDCVVGGSPSHPEGAFVDEFSFLAPLSRLEDLQLSGWQITQQAADAALASLTALTRLDVSWTLLQYPPPLPHLSVLKMDNCELGGAWEHTYAVYCSTYESTVALPKLQSLSLGGCRFEAERVRGNDVGPRVGLGLLEYLLRCAAALSVLEAAGAVFPAFSIAELEPLLAPLRSLHRLDLDGCSFECHHEGARAEREWTGPPMHAVQLDTIRTLTSLTSLSLLGQGSARQLDDTSLRYLAQLPLLQQLNLASCSAQRAAAKGAQLAGDVIGESGGFTDDGLRSLVSAATALTSLQIFGRRITGSLGQRSEAESFADGESGGSGDALWWWSGMLQLRRLRLEGPQVFCPDVVEELVEAGLTSLEVLEFTDGGGYGQSARNTATRHCMRHLAALPRLAAVTVSGLPVTLEGVWELACSTSLRRVDFQSTPVQQPAAIQELRELFAARAGGELVLEGKVIVDEDRGQGTPGTGDDVMAPLTWEERLRYDRSVMEVMRTWPSSLSLPHRGGVPVRVPLLISKTKRW